MLLFSDVFILNVFVCSISSIVYCLLREYPSKVAFKERIYTSTLYKELKIHFIIIIYVNLLKVNIMTE